MSVFEADWVSLSDHLDARVAHDDAAVDASVHGDEDAAETYSDMAASHRRRAHRAASRLGLADLLAAREYDAVTEAACRVYDLPMSDQLNDEWASSNPGSAQRLARGLKCRSTGQAPTTRTSTDIDGCPTAQHRP